MAFKKSLRCLSPLKLSHYVGTHGTTSHNLDAKTVGFRIVVLFLLAHDPAHEQAHLAQSTSLDAPFERQSSYVACYTGMGKGGG